MKVTRLALLSLIGIFCFNFSNAQELGDSIYYVVPSTIEPSSNNAMMIRNTDLGVNLYKGSPDIKIPLYTISTNGYQIPIYLQYNATGMKVDDQTGAYGMGWDLVAGGKIARTIKDKRDEIEDKGYAQGFGVSIMNSDLIQDYDNIANCGPGSDVGLLYPARKDGQPDIFHYSLPNSGGKFIIAPNGNAVGFPLNNVRVSHPIGTYATEDEQMRLIDENGFQYDFDQYETSQTIRKVYYGKTSLPFNYVEVIKNPENPELKERRKKISDWQDDELYVSAWHLGEVKNFNNDLIASFTYESVNVTEFNYSESNIGIADGNPTDCFNKSIKFGTSDIAVTKTARTLKMVKSISTENVEVEFIYRIDNNASTNRLLDEVVIKDKSGNHKITYNFDYSSHQVGFGVTDDYRIFLKGISRNNEDFYKFTYYDEDDTNGFENKHYKNSPYADAWGYFKNSTNELTSKLPKTSITYDGMNVGGQLLKSSPDLSSTKKGALYSVINKLGGGTAYEYELNSHRGELQGGLRVKNIEKWDVNGNVISSRSFKYEYDVNSSNAGETSSAGGEFIYPDNGYDHQFIDSFIDCYDQSLSDSWCTINDRYAGIETYVISSQLTKNRYFDDYSMGYDEVIEVVEGHGRIVRNFTSGIDSDQYETVSDNILVITYWTKQFQMGVLPNGCEYRSMLIDELIPESYAKVTPVHKYGLLQSEKVYTESNVLMTEKFIQYTSVQTADIFWGLQTAHKAINADGWPSVGSAYQYTRFKFVPEYFHKSSETVKNYNTNSTSIEFTATENNYYYNSYGQLKIKEVNGVYPDNEGLEYHYYYPSDMDFSYYGDDIGVCYGQPCGTDAVQALWTLKTKNAIAQPFQITKYTDQEIIEYSQLMKYQLIYDERNVPADQREEILNHNVFPETLYTIGNRSGQEPAVDNPEVSTNSATDDLQIDSRFEEEIRFKYDLVGDNYRLVASDDQSGIQKKYSYNANGNFNKEYTTKANEMELVIIDDFENGHSQYWGQELNSYSTQAFSGNRCGDVQGTLNISSQPSSWVNAVQISFAYKNYVAGNSVEINGEEVPDSEKTSVKNGWTIVNHIVEMVQGAEDISITFDGSFVDNLIIAPISSGVKIITHDDVYGITSTTDKNGNTIFYEYDNLGRLARTKNTQGHIIEEYDYNLIGN